MAESVVNKVADDEGGEENVEENTERKGHLDAANMDTLALAELNLILLLWSLSLSSEECPNIKGKSVENRKEKRKISNSQTRRPEINEFRSAGRQISGVHTKIRDCRHCRRM